MDKDADLAVADGAEEETKVVGKSESVVYLEPTDSQVTLLDPQDASAATITDSAKQEIPIVVQIDEAKSDKVKHNDPGPGTEDDHVKIKRATTEDNDRAFGMLDRFGFLVTDTVHAHDESRKSKAERAKQVANQKKLDALRIRKWGKMVARWDHYNRWWKKSTMKNRIRKGIPDCYRGKVWQILANVEQLKKDNPNLYSEIVNKSASGAVLCDSTHHKVNESISRDINRTFPRNAIFFDKDGVGQRALMNVLKAYATYDDYVGYCQGMGFVVGLLLGYMTEEDAFLMLVVLMKKEPYKMHELFQPGMPGAQRLLFQFEKLLTDFFPKLAAHLDSENIVPSMYATHWFITVLSYSFPFEVVVRVWDAFLNEGWKVVFRVTLALMKIYETKLLECHFEQILEFLRSMPTNVDVEELMETAFKLPLTTKQLDDAKAEFMRQ